MAGRPHRDRLLQELSDIRKELTEEAHKLKPEEFNWAPRPDMKTCKALLQEIGTMEKICVSWITQQTKLEWDKAVAWSGQDARAILSDLEKTRAETLRYLNSCTEEKLQTPVALPEAWHQYWGPTVEPEEMLRWVTRHEYYHLGQLITYRWILGDNPYKRP
jgi:uncharacterized damage-inducible protein DinB